MPFACSSLVHFDVILNMWFAAARKSCSNALGKRAGPLGLKYGFQAQRLSVGSAGLAHLSSKNERHLFSLKSKTIIFGIFDSTVGMFNGESGSGNSKIQNFILHVYQVQLGLGTWLLEPSCQQPSFCVIWLKTSPIRLQVNRGYLTVDLSTRRP